MVLSPYPRPRSSLPWHPEFPIAQTVRLRDARRRSALMRETWRRPPATDGTIYVADGNALRILGCSEGALTHAIVRLRSVYGEALVVEPPSVRYLHGARVLEPWMDVLINAPERCCFLVERDFLRRRGDIRRLVQDATAFVLEGEAPLADLLGYAEWLADLTKATTNVAMWLSRYLPIDSGPKAA